MQRWDAIVVGAGPNGLAAAVTLADRGLSVLLREGAAEVGGSARSAALTLPGYVHDVCSAVHPLAVASPFFRALPLSGHGLEWIEPPAALAHPFEDAEAVLVERDPERTAAGLGEDGPGWLRLFGRHLRGWDGLLEDVLTLPRPPRHPVRLAAFGLDAVRSARGLAQQRLKTRRGRAAFAGMAAHAFLPLDRPGSAAFGLVLGLSAHGGGWPIPRGGAGALSAALRRHLEALGGTVETGAPVRRLAELPSARAVLLDVTPRQLLALAEDRLPPAYRRTLSRWRYGPGAFKLDWALSGPIPWRDPACLRAGTVHLGGSLEELAASEAAPWQGRVHARPYVLLVQPSLFDPSRAPAGRHTAWAYCHVSNGWTGDAADAVEAQVERFAPGFRGRILGRSVRPPAALERDNPNLVGGDVNGGALELRQLLARPALGPTLRLAPWETPVEGLYLCSSSTPPGPGVHGMCGYLAALRALRRLERTGAGRNR